MRHRPHIRHFAGLLAAGALAAGAQAQSPMEIEHLFEIGQVGSAALSPDGEHVAYALSDPRNIAEGEENGAADIHLWIGRRGQTPRAYVQGDITVSDVAWRPGAGTVTFTAKRGEDEHRALYEIDPQGGEAVRLFAHENDLSRYVWGPDGQTLYFVAEAKEEDEPFEDRGFDAYAYEEDPDYSYLWSVRFEDGQVGEPGRFDLDGDVSDIEMSHSGETIAVALAPTPLIDDFYMNRRWHIVETDGGEVRAVVETDGKIGQVAFSPDDSRLAFITGVDVNDPAAGTLAVVDASSGAYTLIARAAEQHVQDADWLDNDSILALAHVSTQSALVTYSVTGREERRVVQDDVVVRDFDLDHRSGRFAAIADSARHPREVFFGDRRGNLRRLHDHNPLLAGLQLGEQRVFSYEARDGVRIDGVLITPPGEAPEGGWPLILTVHGGPEAHDSDGWLTSYSDPGHIGAGDGYAVYYPNYRGSTGRGVDFAKAHQQDYAGTEFDDLVDAVDALAEAGIVDPDRAGITGGSYGGYASMWGATALSEHFAASVAFVGISDNISKFGTTDIPTEMYHVHARIWPWEDWRFFLERSPIFHVDKAQTPLLILHGEEDTRVHPSQSMELYRHMKVRTDTPVRLIFYPGEGHGNRGAAAQFDYAHRMMRWFDHYLMGEGGEPPAQELPLEELIGSEEEE
ncbi:S9 family peptidase [Marinicauda algicola]|uniref:S9 family peptidase n=1 Tax=Marinicauda algicola TaxID=2029849 RepID=A0A4S2H4A1_9PROT|nr:S9 family peptidase [Marinicauda algicola]TGY90434.1 S9 family peptidase [Marinicauda algicola]